MSNVTFGGQSTMRAAVYTEYGGPEVVTLSEIAKPTPRDDELLIRVHATTVNSADHRIRAADFPRGFGTLARLFFGFRRPKRPVLGVDLAGVVEAIGSRVTRFAVGDRVIAMAGAGLACHAEYRAVREGGAVAGRQITRCGCH